MIDIEERNKRFTWINILLHQYDPEPSHAKQVAKLALQFFDELKSLHKLDSTAHDLLYASALLHDIGWCNGETKHHKNSMKLILSQKLPGWSDDEKALIANIARYHRKTMPKMSHKRFARLALHQQALVSQLASLLRLADGLDRSHESVVDSVRCVIHRNKITVWAQTKGDASTEQYGFEKKKAMFEQYFSTPIQLLLT
ncbi:HD domain-containing protein [candidate division KSB1 bacterium]|nr:HD domain-containing protein [candidate division KSB1 bacterium]